MFGTKIDDCEEGMLMQKRKNDLNFDKIYKIPDAGEDI